MLIRYCKGLLVFLALCGVAAAQPVLNFKRIDLRYPTVTCAFRVDCGGAFRTDIKPMNIEVRENGFLMKDVTVYCPDSSDCCVSVSMVLDRTGSMGEKAPPSGTKIQQLKTGASLFVDKLNTPCDEASIVTFNTSSQVDYPLGTNKIAMKNAIQGMSADGNTALWDATAVGVRQLAGARNRCRAVVLFTDGGDNSSKIYRNVQSIIAYAQQAQVKVFTIGFGQDGVGTGINEDDLKLLAEWTGGEYYHVTNGTELLEIYNKIRQSIKDSYQECTVTYTTGCPDGTQRIVDLILKDYCGGTVISQKTYMAPLDRKQFTPVQLSLGHAQCRGTQEAIVPLNLDTHVNGIFGKCDFTVVYDRRFVSITGFSTAGTLLDGVPVTMADVGSGHQFSVKDNVAMNGSGPLMYIRVRTADVASPLTTQIWIANWEFWTYCLIPNMSGNTIDITPREPLLSCEAQLPDTIRWNDVKKEYTPNPFQITILARNTGTKESLNMRARITINSPGVTLSAPLSNVQTMTPSFLSPGMSASATWELRAANLEHDDTVSICFDVTSSNHPTIQCCRTLVVGMMQTPSLVCRLTAPDTIFFREQYYDPEEFDIRLLARNVGSGQATDVFGQLLQDTRFTIMSPAHQLLASVLAPGEQDTASFHVRMHPRDTDGYDTVRVNVQGRDTDPSWCSYPIWVQRERAPKFSLVCTTPDDQLEFSDSTLDYAPNPFVVTTVATNVGETYAEDCQIMFVGPPRFTPIGTNIRGVGTMQVNDTRSQQWLIRALPRTVAGWDTLVFQVIGRGGLGRRIVIGECRLPVYVPAIRLASIVLSCDAPDSIRFVNNAYAPDPFPFTLNVTNTGTASARRLNPSIVLPSGVRLATDESATKSIAELPPSETRSIVWMLRIEPRSNAELVRICGRLVDSTGITGECCRDVHIAAEHHPVLAAQCAAIDTLYIDNQTGAYIGNPFAVDLTVPNTGTGPAENVHAVVDVFGPAVRLTHASNDFPLGDIPSGGSAGLRVNIEALARTKPSIVTVKFTITAGNHGPVVCSRDVFIQSYQQPTLTVSCSSLPEDSLLFDWTVGDYSPPEITVNATMRNASLSRALNVSAVLVLPQGVYLAPGETALRRLAPPDLEADSTGRVSWRVRPMRQMTDLPVDFRIIVRSDNAADVECVDRIIVQGSPKSATLSIPRDVLLRFGEKTSIPVRIDRTRGKDLSTYTIDLTYDPSVLSILYATPVPSLTQFGWVGVTTVKPTEGRVRIADYTTSSPLNTEEGVLVNLLVEGVYRGGNGGGFGSTPLTFDTTNTLLSLGDIALHTIDGLVYVTNDCLEPLTAASGFLLKQNTPNPFNPETRILFSLPEAGYATLTVMDKMGREIARLAHGPQQAGRHEVRFDGTGLPSGMYFYRLDSQWGSEVRKMILAR
jgi:hypothetical protein